MKKFVYVMVVSFMALSLTFSTAQAEEKDYSKPQDMVVASANVLKRFGAHPEMSSFKVLVKNSKAIFVVPNMLRAGFVFGGSGGSGALLSRDQKTGTWSYPVFYSMGSVSFGLQAGADSSAIVLVVMTEKGMDSLLAASFKLGADVSVAAGPVGVGAKAATADVLAFNLSKGLYGGATIDGAAIKPRDKWNSSYYGGTTSPADVIVRQAATNPNADTLREVVAGLAN